MIELFDRVVTNLIERISGPLSFRLLLQPTMAIIVAVGAGVRDARAGRPPYLHTIWTDPTQRRELLLQGIRDVARVLLLATLIDVAYQVLVFRWIYPGEALIVALILAFVPYLVVRGPATRIARRVLRRNQPGHAQASRNTRSDVR